MGKIVCFLLFILTFCFIVPAKVILFGFDVSSSSVISFALFSLYIYRMFFTAKISLKDFYFTFCIAVSVLFSMIVTIYGGAQDFFILLVFVKSIVMFFAASELVKYYKWHYGLVYEIVILQHVFFVGAVNALIALLMLAFPAFSTFVYGFFVASESGLIHLEQGYRSAGLFYSGASVLSMFNAIVFFIGTVCIGFLGKYKYNFPTLLLFSCSLLVVLLATAVAGRTGLLVIFFSIFLVFLFPVSSQLKRSSVICSLLIATLLLLIFVMFIIPYETLVGIASWALEFAANYLNSGEVSSASTTQLLNDMYFLPDRITSLIFGNGSFGRGEIVKYIDSDVGYVLMIFYAGIVGVPVLMLCYLFSIALAVNSKNICLKYSIYFVVFCIFLGNFKDVYLPTSSGVTQILFILIAALRFKNNKILL